MGNHDYAAIYEPTNFHPNAEAAAFWTRGEFEREPDLGARSRRWSFLIGLPIRQQMADGVLCVHGSPRRPINEYVFPDDVHAAPSKMQQIFDRVQRTCLVGHTHVQGVFTDQRVFHNPPDIGYNHPFKDGVKSLANVGSVGQPRDRDPRSGYAILHQDHLEFVRLPYDIQAVVKKVKAIPQLNDFFGQRLLEGR